MSKKVKAEDLPYRPCVGIMVLNKEDQVWTGLRINEPPDSEYHNSPYRWQMPQGGIDKGEDPQKASLRELYEETGMKTVSLLAETNDWLTYDLPDELIGTGLKGKWRGQKQKWFAYRFEGNESEIQVNPPVTGEKAEFEEWAWKPMHKLPDLIVPFKRELYKKIVDEFSNLMGKR
ncbi:RNA pyrophosphohydrolase [Lentilitoribacter sp. Alg239-R112]|uniref:RNA pyrophosphohydrolase n=1 Tax=Lentilitoribacter sp. Alg239-R112 TaxID=2305987 RepID=UPI0013A6EF2A|nr:RNA pyrophosphohydrolase [Lentilitoribacter sp. Alg239-R112]